MGNTTTCSHAERGNKKMRVKLKDIGKIVTGKTPSKREESFWDSNDIPFVKPDDFKNDITIAKKYNTHMSQKALTKANLVPANSVLVTCIGTIGKVLINNTEVATNQQINAIIPNDDIDTKYLMYQILTKKAYLNHIANAPVVPIINKTTFGNVEITLHPLEEQKSIAQKLDLAQELIDLRKSSIKKLDELSKALFIEMFGDPVENEMGWEVVELSEILRGKSSNGYFGSKKDYTETGTPTIWIGDFIDKYNIDIDTLKKVNIEDKKKEKYLLEYGDVLFCRSSLTKEGIAKAGFIAKNINCEVIFEDHVIKMPFDTKKILPEYFYFYSYNQFYRLWMYSMSKTATMTTIGQKEILKSPLMLPPLPLQQKFAKRIEKIEAQKALYEEELKRFEDLFESLLSESFA